MSNLTTVERGKPDEDIVIFANHCVFVWSLYLHGKTLFENSGDDDKGRMERTAPVLFGDLNRMFNEYVILQVCKITEPAKDFRKNYNHTIAFLLQHYDFIRTGRADFLHPALGQDLTPSKRSETADGVARESEGRTRIAARSFSRRTCAALAASPVSREGDALLAEVPPVPAIQRTVAFRPKHAFIGALPDRREERIVTVRPFGGVGARLFPGSLRPRDARARWVSRSTIRLRSSFRHQAARPILDSHSASLRGVSLTGTKPARLKMKTSGPTDTRMLSRPWILLQNCWKSYEPRTVSTNASPRSFLRNSELDVVILVVLHDHCF
jgi:hypothetical protein